MEYGKKRIFGKVFCRRFLIKNFKRPFKKKKIEKTKMKMAMKKVKRNTRIN